jgi:choline-sulfatase
MFLAFNAPHDPRQAPREYVDRYPLDRVTLPENFLPEYPHNESIGSGRTLRDERLAPFPRDEHAVKVNRQEYYASITHMDAQIGRILDALEASGKADETWVIFTSDHGLAVGRHGFMGKQNMYEHSLRVPFIVSGPGVKAGATINDSIYLQDAMATALELAGADRAGVEFHSLIPLLAGQSGKRDAIYGAYTNLQRAVIQDGWKLILYPEIQRERLYHVAEDPFELKDLAGDPTTDGRKKALFAKLLHLQQEFSDKLKLRPSFPDL